MYIAEINKDTKESYLKLSEQQGSIFNSLLWEEKVHSGNMKYYGIFEDDKQMFGFFHLYFAKVGGLTFIKNPPYVPNIGLCFTNKSSNKANALSYNKKVMELLAEFIESLSYSVLSIALPPGHNDTQPFFWKEFKVIPNYTYHLDLSHTEEEIEKGFSPEHRNSLKKAIRENVEVKETNDPQTVKDLVMNTFSRKNKGLNEANIQNILFDLANKDNSFAFAAYHNGKPVAASFCLYDRNECYYLLGGYDKDSKHQGAGILCIQKSISKAKSMGLKIFDFEGSMIREVEKYFRSFGPELVPYYTINKAKVPFEIALKFIKRGLF